MTGEMTHQRAIELEAEKLERLSVQLIQDKNWQALDQMLAPECQFVSSQGACDKASAMRLMKEMNLGPVKFKDFKVTEAEDTLIVSFWIAALEYRDGKELSPDYSPRLSVWKKIASQWQCIAYADLISG
ncbi:nuclear transport factor 2 family protein [Polynucleobacter sp. AP-Titi-500A-B4]|uniref:nuclear transport factor 2 family protein n=1 Tax=Polynucleobacter sp. AP-Titi-500A-B4 TaxID=2576923 RepID=UPI001BFE9C90|nr:nuclear transport factor 2 family protein [Polynucleobacter sp. AP-Titi-500A-B4]QWE12297.1 nuclear transport factor 2 family protein [Polynucleobacter sp. AP-Titi-500A-B4]